MADWLDEAIREAEELRERVIGPRLAVGCRWPVEDCYCKPPYENCAYERKVGHKPEEVAK